MMNTYLASPIDHYIQADIVNKLYTVGVLSFSELKPDDIENSLFMYHMRKLLDRGVAEKTEQGFQLTRKGLRWVNHIGSSTLQPKPLPRLLINFVITNPTNTKIVLARRSGPVATQLNEYLLPGGLYPYGLTKINAAKFVLQQMNIPTESTINFVCMYERVLETSDSYIHHTMSLLYELVLDQAALQNTEHFTLQWVDVSDVLTIIDHTYDQAVTDVITKYVQKNLKQYESQKVSETIV